MDSTAGILQNSQRLRYEALSNFATDLNKATSFKDIGTALTAHAKYIIDTYILRICHSHKEDVLCFEVLRGECKIIKPKNNNIRKFEVDVLANGLPVSYSGDELALLPLAKTIFANSKVRYVRSIPVLYFEDQSVVITAAAKSPVIHVDLDFKFLRSIADLAANKLLQLELLQEIEQNNRELKKKNQQITKLNRTLEQTVAVRTAEVTAANQELLTLFYRTSHDFRAPLANIMGLANLAKLVTDDEDALDLFAKCEQVVKRLDGMLSKLNVLSNYSYESLVGEVNFNQLLTTLKAKYQDKLTSIGGRMVFDVNLTEKHTANAHSYINIIDNLIENSITFHKGNLLIQVYIFSFKGNLVIKFSDNGQGISPRIINKIYDMYYRGHSESTGSGLGLYVVRRLVKSLGGEIYVQSKLKQYTYFIIKVPFHQQQLV
ncbi:HAMP domain-containing histidine kinase [Mucilaginibacter sp. UR6-1]|uniref:sensor histidine kinase n=1 Tax=Mucilaginibacter sp. UR6-1 TaxID=1435643 RepID=UPI001E2EE6D0|nr:HAMP domain-containing sensor histidine kinase [Mucilaginibacter sp. UR6-1]MCC8409065.1 HAMP domain-containing histidine kinase [Mucilaginibacter sp. UR6-1]